MAGFHLRHNERTEAEAAAQGGAGDRSRQRRRQSRARSDQRCGRRRCDADVTPAAQVQTYLRDAIMYLERAIRVLGPHCRCHTALHAGPSLPPQRRARKAIESLSRVLSQNPGFVAGAPVDGAGVCGEQGSEERDRHAAGDSRGRAARRLHAGAVSGTGGPAEGRRRQLHRRARHPASQSRAEVPPHRRAARCEGISSARRRLRAKRRSSIRTIPGSRVCRRVRSSMAAIGPARSCCSSRSTKASPKDTDTLFTLADVYADAGRGPMPSACCGRSLQSSR